MCLIFKSVANGLNNGLRTTSDRKQKDIYCTVNILYIYVDEFMKHSKPMSMSVYKCINTYIHK